MRVVPSEDGYTITGGEPPGLRARPESVRRMYWGWVVEEGIRAKEADLARGLDKDGKPLKPISAYTRAHRRSAMTPTGRGSPSAPPLTPAYQLSRTRSLLTGRAEVDGAEFWWRFDPFTGGSWARILEYQKAQGRDVFGLSKEGVNRAVGRARALYQRWERGEIVPMPREIQVPQAPPIAVVGKTDLTHATMGINAPTSLGQWSGGMRVEDWQKHFRQPAQVTIPARSSTNYNRLLGHIWGSGGSPPAPRPPAPPRPAPPTPRIPIAGPPPARPKPKPRPVPVAGAPSVRPKPTPKGFDWSKAIDLNQADYRDLSDRLRLDRDQFWVSITPHTGDDAELRAKFGDGLKAVVDATAPYIRATPDVLEKVLQSRFMNQFETGTTGGSLDPDGRMDAEAAVMGVPRALAAPNRPIYGYLGEPDFAGYQHAGETWLAEYGAVAIRLKRDVLDRATLTLGDSLSKMDQLQASRAAAPSSISLPVRRKASAALMADAIVNHAGDPIKNLRILQAEVMYVELQYHGGLGPNDIAEVAFDQQPPADLARALDARKIPWRVIP